MFFTEKEKQIISDIEFLKTKVLVVNKIESLFEDVRIKLSQTISESTLNFTKNIDIKVGKIFRGENYQSLPYVVLDYPKLFSKENTFAYRTMFWWGNFFSSTLHIEGKCLSVYRDKLIINLPKYLDDHIFICVNETPWDYHYENDNYQLLSLGNIHLLETAKFIKLSKKYRLTQYQDLPTLSSAFLNTILKILSQDTNE